MTAFTLRAVLVFSLLLSCSLWSAVLSAQAADEITSLPGWTGPLPSKHYSGYFPTTIDGSKAGMLHYWLTLSENKPATDPLVLWLQGGPGCSSLFGLLYENGQLHFTGNTTGVPSLVYNPSSWTKVANMIWLEQPIGVGFSYCLPGATGDCTGNNFGLDVYHFFVNFFKAFPELSNNNFHVTGESYGGVYVPYVADAILTGNQQGKNKNIKLVSIAIGNGLGGDADDNEVVRRQVDFFYGHAAFSYQAEQAVWAACGTNGSISQACDQAMNMATQNVGSYYIYNFYDTCPHDLLQVPLSKISQSSMEQIGAPLFAPVSISSSSRLRDLGFVCVLESVSSDYLNTKSVQEALHVTAANVSGWGPCGNSDRVSRKTVQFHRRFMQKQGLMAPSSVLGDLYKKLIAEIPILIYSGDVDQCVPYYYSDSWVRLMGFPITGQAWQPWIYGGQANQQVGGYVTYYQAKNPLTFLTVKDSGHMVPQYAPEAALSLFTSFLKGGKY